jgi:hypothetical protein
VPALAHVPDLAHPVGIVRRGEPLEYAGDQLDGALASHRLPPTPRFPVLLERHRRCLVPALALVVRRRNPTSRRVR